MRSSDVTRLSQPYGGDPNLPTPGPAAALGVATPTWSQLETTLLGDLSTELPYGIAWWAPHPGTSRRILISDQLYACAHSTGDNLIEAGLHWLEFLDFADRESDRLAYAVKFENGEFVVNHLNLQREVAGFWRPLRICGGRQHGRQILLPLRFSGRPALASGDGADEATELGPHAARLPVATALRGGSRRATTPPSRFRRSARVSVLHVTHVLS
jgi:hypothetical protein